MLTTNPQPNTTPQHIAPVTGKVKIVDIDMPFGSMVNFIIKWTLASIPALILLFLFFMVVGLMFGGLIAGIFGK